MTSMQTFNYGEYVRGFRAACARRGIDPVEGATGYQVVHYVAERDRAERRRIARKTDQGWWARHELWINDCDLVHSETEEDAFWSLFSETYLLTVLRVMRARRRWGMAKRLREAYQARGK